MKLLPSKPLVYALVAIALCLGFWGYCFELAYFSRLELNVHQLLSVKHFVATGASIVLPMLVILLIFSNVKRFFTKDIHSDPTKAMLEVFQAATFQQQVVFARFGAAIAVYFLVLVIALPALGITTQISHVFLYIVFVVLQLFFGAMLLSPSHARLPVMLVFLLAVAACFAGGGYGQAARAHGATAGTILRDDFVVTVKIGANGDVNAEAKRLSLPLPPALKFIERLGEL